jgi:Ca-activated chloride channel family protein
MSFIWPAALLGLLLVPGAVAAYLYADRRRRREAGKFGNTALLAGLVEAPPRWKRHVPVALALAALTLLLVGMARPEATMSVPKEEATVVLAIDTSRSMAANDIAPSRLDAARTAANAFLEKVPKAYRVGIVAFSTRAQVVLPPTDDREAAATALLALRLGSGTSIGDAIERSVTLVRPPNRPDGEDPVPATVLLLSDGAHTAGPPLPAQAAARAKRLGVPVSTVAFGTRETTVEVPLQGGLRQRVVVRPDAETLKRVAAATGGKSYVAQDAEALEEVYRELGTRLGHERKPREVTYAFAAGGALLLLAGGALSTLWFRRAL